MKDNYFNFFTEIEDYFVRKRGKNLLISPLDWGLIELWKENSIPLHIVLRGIDMSFEAAAKRQRSAPRTLFYCHPAIMEAFEAYREARLGAALEGVEAPASGQTGLDKEEILAYLEQLHRTIANRSETACQRAAERLGALIDEISFRTVVGSEQVDRELTEIGSALVGEIAETLPQNEVKTLQSEVKRELKVYKKRISSEMFGQLSRRQLERKLRERLALPEFSLLAIR